MRRNFTRRKSFALALMLVMAATNAFGDTINLTCKADAGNEAMQVTLDPDASTAIAGDDPISSANFSDTAVTWGQVETSNGMWQFHRNYSLNRNTGTLNLYGAMKADNQEKWASLNEYFHCAIAKRLF